MNRDEPRKFCYPAKMPIDKTPAAIAQAHELQLRHAVATTTGIPHAQLTVITQSAGIDGDTFSVGVVSGERWFGAVGTLDDGRLEITQAGPLTTDAAPASSW